MPTRIIASSTSPRLYEDIPDRNQQAIMSAVYNDRNIANSILMSSLTGSRAAALSMLRYGRTDRYHYGETLVETSLDNAAATDIWLMFLSEKYTLGPREFFRVTTIDSREAGQLGRPDAYAYVALQNNPIVEPETFSRFAFLPDGSAEIYKNIPAGEVLHQAVNVPVLSSKEHYAFWARYDEVNGQSTLITEGAEIYNEASNTMPGLHDNSALAPPPLMDEVFPLVPIRLNENDYNEGLEGSGSVRNMLDRANLNPDDIVEAIKMNEDEDLINDVYMGFGIGMAEEDEWAIAAMASTFKVFYESNPNAQAVFQASSIRQNITVRVPAQGGLNSILGFNYINITVKEGNPGYTKTYIQGQDIEACFPAENPNDDINCNLTGSTNQYIITAPIPGTNTYEEILIEGLNLVHIVNYAPRDEDRFVEHRGDDENLVIPLLRGALRKVPYRLQEDVVFGSMRLFIYAIQVIHLEFYETGIFKAILFVVSLILAFFTYGGSLAVGLGIGAAASFLIIAAVLITINYAVQWLAEEIGGVLTTIIVILATVYFGFSSFDFSTLASTLNTTWYTLYTSSIRLYGAYQNEQLEDIIDQQAAFEEDYEARLLELEAAEDLLDFGESLDLRDIIEYRSLPNTNLTESPQSFYDRTSTTIDLPAISSSLVNDYYEVQLTLPEAPDTYTGSSGII